MLSRARVTPARMCPMRNMLNFFGWGLDVPLAMTYIYVWRLVRLCGISVRGDLSLRVSNSTMEGSKVGDILFWVTATVLLSIMAAGILTIPAAFIMALF